MPFKTEQHANLGYVDKLYKGLLDRLCEGDKRPIKAELEQIIEQGFINKFGYEEYKALKEAYEASASN